MGEMVFGKAVAWLGWFCLTRCGGIYIIGVNMVFGLLSELSVFWVRALVGEALARRGWLLYGAAGDADD